MHVKVVIRRGLDACRRSGPEPALLQQRDEPRLDQRCLAGSRRCVEKHPSFGDKQICKVSLLPVAAEEGLAGAERPWSDVGVLRAGACRCRVVHRGGHVVSSVRARNSSKKWQPIGRRCRRRVRGVVADRAQGPGRGGGPLTTRARSHGGAGSMRPGFRSVRWILDGITWRRSDPWMTSFVDCIPGHPGALLRLAPGRTGGCIREWLGEQSDAGSVNA